MTESDSGSNIVEMMPDNVSEAITKAIAEGRLCRYAVDLESRLTAAKEQIEQLKKLKQGYYDEATEGWTKCRQAEFQLAAANAQVKKLKEAGWHQVGCRPTAYSQGQECSCGWAQAIADTGNLGGPAANIDNDCMALTTKALESYASQQVQKARREDVEIVMHFETRFKFVRKKIAQAIEAKAKEDK